MRTIHVDRIAESVAGLCIKACTVLPAQVRTLLEAAQQSEPYQPARESLALMCDNCRIAEQTQIPICQDTGMTVVLCELGQDVHIEGGLLEDAVNRGVSRGYTQGYLRKSVVRDPFDRVNTGDNTPAVLHVRLVTGDRLKITVSPKGFGSENMSRLAMLTPADGMRGVQEFVLETVTIAGANPCPPIMLGVGIGGNFEQGRDAGQGSAGGAARRRPSRSGDRRAGKRTACKNQSNGHRAAGLWRKDHRACRCISKPRQRISRGCRWL